jgi:UDP-glucose 4-epimerase
VKVGIHRGEGHSVREVIEIVETLTSQKVPLKLGEKNPGDPPKLYANPAKAKKILGWEAKHLDLTKTIESTWNWMNR